MSWLVTEYMVQCSNAIRGNKVATDWGNWVSWWKLHPPEYLAAKRELRIARLIAGAIHVEGPAWSACRKHQSRLKAGANGNVRRWTKELERLRQRHGIPVVERWTPRIVAGLDRLRRQYSGDSGLDNSIGVRVDEHGPYFTRPVKATCPASETPAIPTSATVDPSNPALVDDPQPTCPAPEIPTNAPATIEVRPIMNLRTIGQLAKELSVEQHQALYVIRTREIRPVARAGAYRLFDDAAVERIASELKRIAVR